MAEATMSASAEGMNRREFLYYIWGASMALFTAQFTGLLIWFALPRFREGTFGGSFRLSVSEIPEANAPPVNRPDGRFWLVNLDSRQPNERMYTVEGDPDEIVGVAAIYKVCTHLGCIFPWNEGNERFECPCHGSKYRLDGRRIESPAPRTLDRFAISFQDTEGNTIATSEIVDGFFTPVPVPEGAVDILVDTGNRLDGPSQQLICDILNNCP